MNFEEMTNAELTRYVFCDNGEIDIHKLAEIIKSGVLKSIMLPNGEKIDLSNVNRLMNSKTKEVIELK